ncbi:butyrophilin subfamily 1 member A1-like isoform X3 [Phacochoerus africanus]|uniref:butyrophilin subfamily 1 member A1-like isoform X3 n=1 Tax=Phacochoerus africanus TaxID=41426 RepID=UPI001FD91093|nr:butyrophilin subfamily 1 member A1-like isoform X3 [Phacochoerus africanus]
MMTYPRDCCRKLPIMNENHKESQPKVDHVDDNFATCLLRLLVMVLIFYVFREECFGNNQLKENDQLRKENDERKAQFRNGWQKSLLYPDWRKEFFQAVTITLDPDTAHPSLILSEGNRRVTWGEKSQDLPENPHRFYSFPCVLGLQVITSGRCYWEVEVGDSQAWDLGLCRPHVMRKGGISIKPEDGFWAIRSCNDEYWALTSPETQLIPKEHPARVCIFLEYEEGRISFYNMTDKSHIHTFSQGSFEGPLKPFFRLWPSDSACLTICPVLEAAQNPLC